MDEKITRSRKGWLLCEVTRKKSLSPVCPSREVLELGYNGFGELYFSRKSAKEDAKTLNENWNVDRVEEGLAPKEFFKVVRGTLTWEE